jgi:hypothetical protein
MKRSKGSGPHLPQKINVFYQTCLNPWDRFVQEANNLKKLDASLQEQKEKRVLALNQSVGKKEKRKRELATRRQQICRAKQLKAT